MYEKDRKVGRRVGVRAHGSTLYISIRTEQSRTALPTYSFFQARGETVLAQSADVVARVLARYKVPFVFLNACESVVISENKMPNLAKILIGAGISEVFAMSFKFTSSAARPSSETSTITTLDLAVDVLRMQYSSPEVYCDAINIEPVYLSVRFNFQTSLSQCITWRRERSPSYCMTNSR